MKQKVLALIVAIMVILSGSAFALTDAEFKIIQKTADEFLSNEPANGYHLLAEDVLKEFSRVKKTSLLLMCGYLKIRNTTRDIYQALYISDSKI